MHYMKRFRPFKRKTIFLGSTKIKINKGTLQYVVIKTETLVKTIKIKGESSVRILEHPILTFEKGIEVEFIFDGKKMKGYEGEPISAALHHNGIKVLSHSKNLQRPRGFYCAIGNCSSCLMTVNGEPNVRVCTAKLTKGMVVETQIGRGVIK
jgi:hypothetical protein